MWRVAKGRDEEGNSGRPATIAPQARFSASTIRYANRWPIGLRRFSKDEYLGAIASGNINYMLWQPEEIDVRVHLDVGCLRYRSTIKIVVVGGEEGGPARVWHPISTRNRTDDGVSFGRRQPKPRAECVRGLRRYRSSLPCALPSKARL